MWRPRAADEPVTPHTGLSVLVHCSQRLQLHYAVSDAGLLIRCTMHSRCATGSCMPAAHVAQCNVPCASVRPSAATVMDSSNNKAIQPARSVLTVDSTAFPINRHHRHAGKQGPQVSCSMHATGRHAGPSAGQAHPPRAKGVQHQHEVADGRNRHMVLSTGTGPWLAN